MERLRQSCVYWNIDREQRVQKLFHFYDRGVVDQKVGTNFAVVYIVLKMYQKLKPFKRFMFYVNNQ